MSTHYNLAKWWHLLSLDAPTIAALWSWLFARAMHLHMPILGFFLLAVATWLLYVTDRILDGLLREHAELRERHAFHARHRRMFVAAGSPLAVFLGWMVCTRMYPGALKDDLFLAVFALLYLVLVHAQSRLGRFTDSRWLPKELAVALLFAAATAVPAWSHMSDFSEPAKTRLVGVVLLFALLCWINCVAIEKWETALRFTPGDSKAVSSHPSTQWAGTHLRWIVLAIAISSILGAWIEGASDVGGIYLAAFFSSGLFLLLDVRQSLLSPLSLRIAADAALLTPLAIFPILK